jgi:hypothetical protein
MNKMMRNYLVACHLVLPVAFGLVAYLFRHHPALLTLQMVVLILLGALPFILPLLSYYVKGIGKDGVMMNNVFEGSVRLPQEPVAIVNTEVRSKEKSFNDYSRPARKVLRTLWKFQNEQFKGDFTQRWSFGVHPLALDYPQFHSAIYELKFDGLIINDDRGMVFLSNQGIEFSKNNRPALEAGGDIWDRFGPA